jgi:hypothetical protein
MFGRPTYYSQRKFFEDVDTINRFDFVSENVEEYL